MSIATEIQRIQRAKADIKAAINVQKGVETVTSETIDDYAGFVSGLNPTPVLEVGATTVRYDASHTENIASNSHIRIRGNDGKDYTIAEWNALFVAAGYDKDAMSVEPIGLRIQCFDTDEIYLFDRYSGITYSPVGDTAGVAGKLQHSIYNQAPVTAAASGTDYATGKTWRITADGDDLILYEANTGQSWRKAKNTGSVSQHRAWNIAERTHAAYVETEWMRHRMAIDSGLTTTAEDGTYATVEILNASGQQSAVGEDMYFWIGGVSTGKLAKYNLNNRHAVNSLNLTQAISDAIYARQIANGINMNDTGVNSASKPILAPGSKGAEAIAVSGKWYIITPFISNPSATTATGTNNMADAPAVYWAVSKGCSLPSESLLAAMYWNLAICNAAVNYLRTREGRAGVLSIPTSDYIWSAVRVSAGSCWGVSLTAGYVSYAYTYARFFVVGASAS